MSRGGAPNRMAIIIMIQAAPPPRPACFTDDAIWKQWLISAHVEGLRIVRRIDVGKTQGCRITSHRLLPTAQIPYCDGCTSGHQATMKKQGRCTPCTVEIRETETA